MSFHVTLLGDPRWVLCTYTTRYYRLRDEVPPVPMCLFCAMKIAKSGVLG
jgi:hypothetical protein